MEKEEEEEEEEDSIFMKDEREISKPLILISKYFHAKHRNDKLKVFKLLFRIEEFSLCLFENPFFEEDFQKWERGPVIANLWRHHWKPIEEDVKDLLQSDEEMKKTVKKEISTDHLNVREKLRADIGKYLGEPILDYIDLVEHVFRLETGFKMSDETHKQGTAWDAINQLNPINQLYPAKNYQTIPKELIREKGLVDPYFIEFKRLYEERQKKESKEAHDWIEKQPNSWYSKAASDNPEIEKKNKIAHDQFIERWKSYNLKQK